ncbi:MAG: N-acetylmuramoyl-L-alanine amidase [Bacteroidales bacterium]|nr:N-acetylmuramoyl-L-alanine amidase [Bacteroidales bacterium]
MPLKINRILLILFFFIPAMIGNHAFAQERSIVKLKNVVIDAGHGGHDPGALSPDKKIKEKNLTLDFALRLGKKINDRYPDINVIYTRSTDEYITLDKRSSIANKNHADLFISIHINSYKGKKSPSGFETFIMGMDKSSSNMAVCKTENSVVLLEDDYTTTYQGYDPDKPESFIFFNLMQNANFEQSLILASLIQDNLAKGPIKSNRGIKQIPLLVLWRTTMPAVLVELGFLPNPSDRSILMNKDKRDEIAEKLFCAFREFKDQYENVVELDPFLPEQETHYRIQIFSTTKKLDVGAPDFKGLKEIDSIKVDNLYKYSVGKYKSLDEAKLDLPYYSKIFKGAFVIKIEKGKIVR